VNKIILVLVLTLSSLWAVEFYSYEDALELQKKNHKIIMLDVVRTDCHYCEDMDRKVFQNAAMTEWLDERFIAVKMNLDKEKLPLGIEVNFTPSFYFINADKEIVKKIPGSWSIEDFKDLTKGIK